MEMGVNDLGQQELSARVGWELCLVRSLTWVLCPAWRGGGLSEALVGPGGWELFSTELGRNLQCVALLQQDKGVGKVCLGWLSPTCCISCPLPSSLSSMIPFPIFLLPLITLLPILSSISMTGSISKPTSF